MTLTNPVHIAFIVVIALIFLGPKRLPEVARGLGTGMREFRESLSGTARQEQTAALASPSDDAAPPATVDAVAATPQSADPIAAPPPGPTAQ
jgi:sec-independent protein translocase protein TatA